MKILYGTGNKEKLKQMKKIVELNNINIDIIGIKDIGFDKNIVEDGETFEENSKIKAKAIRQFCNENNINDVIILADDAGLCVDALDGKPGVYSARYAGDHASQEITLNKLLTEMEDVKEKDRTAQFVCALTASLPNGEFLTSKGVLKGKIANKPGKMGGLTYEPVFIPEGFEIPIGDMSPEEFTGLKHHRTIAIMGIIKELKKLNY